MPGKHAARQFGLPRYSFVIAAAAVLVLLVGWVAFRAAGPDKEQDQPILVVPSTTPAALALPVTTPPSTGTPKAKPVTPAAKPVTPAAKLTRTVAPVSTSSTPARRPSSRPPASAAPPVVVLQADYRTGAENRRSFIGGIQISNPGAEPREWQVALTYAADSAVELTGVMNAESSHTGDTWTLTGPALAPGATTLIGFQATKRTRDAVRPVTCAVNGTPCRVN
ncbi:cellulose binding domain-containing protein [Actinoplanes sp. NPDC051859]|uniref:cellulose binding domain-containing protein n=1 Tax=Actinoplanes sp. NPDC051859 TaxID=3363909 RepID=UPI00378E1C1B